MGRQWPVVAVWGVVGACLLCAAVASAGYESRRGEDHDAPALPAIGTVTVVNLGGRVASAHAWYWTQSRLVGGDGRGNALMNIWRTSRLELRIKGERRLVPVEEIRAVTFSWTRGGAGLDQRRTVMTLRSGEEIEGEFLEAWNDTKAFGQVHVVIPELKERIAVTSPFRMVDERAFDRAPRQVAFMYGSHR